MQGYTEHIIYTATQHLDINLCIEGAVSAAFVLQLAAPSCPVRILQDDERVLCVCKPSGIP